MSPIVKFFLPSLRDNVATKMKVLVEGFEAFFIKVENVSNKNVLKALVWLVAENNIYLFKTLIIVRCPPQREKKNRKDK